MQLCDRNRTQDAESLVGLMRSYAFFKSLANSAIVNILLEAKYQVNSPRRNFSAGFFVQARNNSSVHAKKRNLRLRNECEGGICASSDQVTRPLQLVFQQREPADRFYVLLRGEVTICMNDKERMLEVMHKNRVARQVNEHACILMYSGQSGRAVHNLQTYPIRSSSHQREVALNSPQTDAQSFSRSVPVGRTTGLRACWRVMHEPTSRLIFLCSLRLSPPQNLPGAPSRQLARARQAWHPRPQKAGACGVEAEKIV